MASSFLAAACAAVSLPPQDLEQLRKTASYSARLHVGLDAPTLRARTLALVAFARPDSLRVEIPGPTGARLIVVARAGRLVAVFPRDHALFEGEATSEGLRALLGVDLTPEEVMDLLLGTPPPRLRSSRFDWGASYPKRMDVTLPDGARLSLKVEEAERGVSLPKEAFLDPAHDGYRRVGAEEARSLWGNR